ncbi:uncharacterized protein LOC9662716 [Selaginella moellendorffii]|uniref:uncharacterized protein LOC9662716 n=1 Tax=Selaginella moellendorffii TaxID=88036 RepID=UPI000D1CED4F|nr:uncharacterized protein LOC9662716 [Selaginella moellendorffii]|eukprot:XP_002988323.2 uncharacterized protein LOC9662716 [Selaginella moellendorffii]
MASAAVIRPHSCSTFIPGNRQGVRATGIQKRLSYTHFVNAALQRDSPVVEDSKRKTVTKQMSASTSDWSNESLKSELGNVLQEKIAALEKQNVKDINKKAQKIAEFVLEEISRRSAKRKDVVEKTSVADANLTVEKTVKDAASDAAVSVATELEAVADEARKALETAKECAQRAEETLAQKLLLLEKVPKPELLLSTLEESVASLEKQLEIAKDDLSRLQFAADAAKSQAKVAEARAAKADVTIQELRQKVGDAAQERASMFNETVESLRATASAREESLKVAFEAQLAALQAAMEASEKAKKIKEQANLRRFQAFENALAASEASLLAWKERALNSEGLLQRSDAEWSVVFSDGRMTALLGGDKIAELVEGGPRREIPDWMKKRIQAAMQGIPPRHQTTVSADTETSKPLELPSLEEVWSVAKAKVKQDDLFSKDVVAKETLDKQRRDLEQALGQTTITKRKGRVIKEKPESGTGSGREIVFQGFNWESCRKRWYQDLAPKAADLSQSGITTVWFPPPTESVAPQGYMPVDLYNLNSAYGSMDELKHCIQEMHKHDLLVLGDVVLNHRCAYKQNSNGVWNIFGGKLSWGPEAIVNDDPNFQGRGNPSSGDIFHAAPNIDHSQAFVRKDIKEYLDWLKTEIGYDGWRLDFVRGFWGGYVKEYIEASEPAFAIGEYWDSLLYEGGNVAYNQDAHRQRIIDWINATGGTSSAFDVTTKGILHAALHNEYWRLIDPRQKPPGVMGWWPSRAVTFLENHDTGSTQGHWPFPRDKLLQGYAYILTHPGTPVIFYDHFYDFGLRDPIVDLIAARNRTGINCRSPVKIFHANNDGYVAKVGEQLVVKLGRFDWNPSKQNDLIGNWKRSVGQGSDYQVWEEE